MLKKLLFIIAAIGITSLTFASNDAFYAPIPLRSFIPSVYTGIQGGFAATNWNHSANPPDNSYGNISKSNAGGGRIYLGYNFRPHLSFEAGYTQFFNHTDIENYNSDEPYYSWAIDTTGKLQFHVFGDFDFYAKVGFDYMNSRIDSIGSGKDKHAAHSSYNVLFGLGGVYNITDNLSMDLSWTRYGGSSEWGSSGGSDYVPDADLYALGFAYKFNLM